MNATEKIREAYTLGYDNGTQHGPLPSDADCVTEMPGPLSGEYAGDMTPRELCEILGVDYFGDSETDALIPFTEQLCDAFEIGYYAALYGDDYNPEHGVKYANVQDYQESTQ